MKPTVFGLLLLIPAVGCFSLQKTGPLWPKDGPSGGPTRSQVNPKAVVLPPRDAAPALEEGGPRPPEPAFLVTPNEVNSVNAHEIAARVREEMQRDLNAPFPAYPVVSHVRR